MSITYIIQIKNDIFVCVEGTRSSDLPELKLIEFNVKREGKSKTLNEDFEGEEIDYLILDSFHVIKQEYDFSHEETYEFPSNILYLKENEIVASFESDLKFIKINNNKNKEKKILNA